MSAAPYELPPGWEWQELADFCTVTMGSSPKSATFTDSPDVGSPFLQGNAEFGERHPTPKKGTTDPLRLAPAGSVLVSVRAPVGAVNITEHEVCIGRGLAALTPERSDDLGFIFWALQASRLRLQARATGTTFPAVTGPALKSLVIPVPPASDREGIVAAIEEMFARIDSIEGELAEARSLRGVFDRSLIRQSLSGGEWPSPPLASVTTLFTDGDWVLKEDLRTGRDVRLIQLGDIGVGLFKDKSDKWISSARAGEMGVTYLHPGDVLISRMAEPLARACQLPSLDVPAITAVDVTIARVDPAKCLPEYLVMALNNIDFRLAAERVASGTTRLRITRKKLEALTIPLPPLEIQQAIVSAAHEQQRMVGEVDETVRGVEAALASLRASVLHRAFTGQLVTPRTSGELAGVHAGEVAA